MNSVVKKVFYDDLVFKICENVYEPAEDSFLIADNLCVNPGSRVLDMGTGCGILGIISAKQKGEVIAVDVNPFAMQCAKQNAQRNLAEHKIIFIQGNLFSFLRDTIKFDLILFNAPYLPSGQEEDNSWISLSWDGGESGRRVIDTFIRQAPNYLAQNGRILLVQSSLSNIEETIDQFVKLKLTARIKASKETCFFEKIVLIEIIN